MRAGSVLGVRSCLCAALAATVVASGILLFAPPAQAATVCEKITDSFASSHSEPGSDFAVIQKTVSVGSGSVVLAKDCAGTEKISVDDGIIVEATRPDGSMSAFSHDFSGGCSGSIAPAGPFDLTSLFAPGANSVKVRFRDLCGQGGSSASDVFLVYTPPSEPIIFVHGFVGSKIFCGAQELWPNLPKPRLRLMNLNRDGRTNAGCASAGPRPGQLFETALGGDVYKSTIDFLRSASPNVHLYAWDWRKNPEEAVAGLDALVNQVKPPGGKVVLMAHSAGGLVVRSYVEDPGRAAKISRALTVATPYWGSPKSLFPFLYGVESPDISTLDVLLKNDEFKDFARFLQGMFFLWPSARYGGWLSIEGQPSPLKTKALLDFVEDQGGNRSLLATALGAHARRLDELRTNGVDYQTVVGSGLHTIGAVEISDTPLLSRDLVEVDWVNGDGTVPLTSARAATPAVRQHFVCGVSHVPLPGNPTVDLRVRDFLLEDKKPIDDAFPVSGSLCEPQGFALSIFSMPGVAFTSSVASAGPSAASALSLDQAEQSGLLEAVNTGSQIEAATSTTAPFTVGLKNRGAALRIAPMTNGEKGKARIYGPLKAGNLTIELGRAVTVRLNGKKQKGRPDDTRRPKTRITVRKKGKQATLAFKVRDASQTSTYVKVGKRVRKVGKTLTLPAARLRKGITFQSIDAFGNAEKPKKLKR